MTENCKFINRVVFSVFLLQESSPQMIFVTCKVAGAVRSDWWMEGEWVGGKIKRILYFSSTKTNGLETYKSIQWLTNIRNEVVGAFRFKANKKKKEKERTFLKTFCKTVNEDNTYHLEAFSMWIVNLTLSRAPRFCWSLQTGAKILCLLTDVDVLFPNPNSTIALLVFRCDFCRGFATIVWSH